MMITLNKTVLAVELLFLDKRQHHWTKARKRMGNNLEAGRTEKPQLEALPKKKKNGSKLNQEKSL